MAWFRVDDGFYDHPKLEGVSMAARGLWLTAGTYCARHLTDGEITARQVRILGGTPAQIRALVGAGLWKRFKSESGVDSYAFHDWLDMQPSRKEVEEKRETEAERKRKWREAKAAKQQELENVPPGRTLDVRPESRVASALPGPTRPDPSLLYRAEREGGSPVTRTDSPSNPSVCEQHPGGTDKPCAGCARARQHREEAAERDRAAAAEARSTAARQAAADRAAAIADCSLCDEHGYRGTTVCDHTDYTHTAEIGVAAARAALTNSAPEPRFTRP